MNRQLLIAELRAIESSYVHSITPEKQARANEILALLQDAIDKETINKVVNWLKEQGVVLARLHTHSNACYVPHVHSLSCPEPLDCCGEQRDLVCGFRKLYVTELEQVELDWNNDKPEYKANKTAEEIQLQKDWRERHKK